MDAIRIFLRHQLIAQPRAQDSALGKVPSSTGHIGLTSGRLSSPLPSGKPSLYSPSLRLSVPSTTQHPHPVPLHRTESLSEFDFTVPAFDLATNPWSYSVTSVGMKDGLEVMVPREELPCGTPGGKRNDLRRGAFVDGEPNERGGKPRPREEMLTASSSDLLERHTRGR